MYPNVNTFSDRDQALLLQSSVSFHLCSSTVFENIGFLFLWSTYLVLTHRYLFCEYYDFSSVLMPDCDSRSYHPIYPPGKRMWRVAG